MDSQEKRALAARLSQPAKEAAREAAAAAEDAARLAVEERRAAEQLGKDIAAAAEVFRKLQAMSAAADKGALAVQLAAKGAGDLLAASDFGVRKQLDRLFVSTPGLLLSVGLGQARLLLLGCYAAAVGETRAGVADESSNH